MSDEQTYTNQLIEQLLSTGCLKFGKFTLKSGQISPYYVDLRESTMCLKLFKTIVHVVVEQIKQLVEASGKPEQMAVIGIPYGVVPLAAVAAYECELPYYPIRKEVKEYGNKTDMSKFENKKFILIEDVMSTGSSILETISKLDVNSIAHIIAIVDREAGGRANIEAAYPHIKLHSILQAQQILKRNNGDKL